LKVLQLVQKPQFRGAEIFTCQLASHINQTGHKASLAFVFPGASELPFKDKIFHLNGNKAKRFGDVQAWRRLAEIIKEEKPDIIQANAGDTLKYAVFSKLLFRWKQPIVFRNASTISLYIKAGWAKTWNSFFFNRVDKIISVSKTSAEDFANLYPQLRNKITTIPVGIENNSPEEGGQLLSKEQDLTRSNPVLVHVGGFSFEKNHKGLISIFERILKKKPGAELHLVGDGPLRQEIEALVNQKKLTNNIFFHGFQKNALEYIWKADVLVLPSIIEGLPGVILEAFFCKTPVVAYNVGGIKEVVINGDTGRLIAKDNEELFAKAVFEAIEKTDENDRLVETAYKLVTTKYLNTQIAKEFLKVYDSIVN
jgi:glycosyltransferase involved in cell wall biosynthesis